MILRTRGKKRREKEEEVIFVKVGEVVEPARLKGGRTPYGPFEGPS
jgi:hypothetical protein